LIVMSTHPIPALSQGYNDTRTIHKCIWTCKNF